MSAFLRKYGTGSGADVYIPMIKRAAVDFAVSADWTPAAGDVKVSQDGAAAANIGTLPAAVTMGNTAMWKFVFSDAELQCAALSVTVADAATKAVEDQMFVIETYGHASAMHAFDFDTASAAQSGDSFARIGATGSGLTSLAPASTALSTAQWTNARAANLDNLDAAISTRSTYAGADTSGTTTLLTRLTAQRASNLDHLDAAISTRSSHAAADVWSAATRTLTAFGFSVTVGTNNDKTGYGLTAAERNSIADAWLDRSDAVETGITPRLAVRYIAAACAGTLSGSQTSTEVFAGIGVGTTRITATVDGSGNRTGIVLA
jgi:hypothetical protein